MHKNIIVVIQNGMDNFSDSEKRIAGFIIEHYKEIVYMSTMQVAKACDVSDATLIRFCRKIQLSGFKDLKVALSIDLSQITQLLDNESIHETINANDSTEDIIKKITYGNTKALSDTVSVMNPAELEKAILTVIRARKVYILGVGGSSVVALDLYYKFTRVNINTFFQFDHHIQLLGSAFITKEDVVIGISNSGKTSEVVNIMERCKKNGVPTIAITQYGVSPICKHSDIVLFNSTTESNMRVGAMASRIAQLNIVDALFVGVLAQDYSRYRKYLQQTRELFSSK